MATVEGEGNDIMSSECPRAQHPAALAFDVCGSPENGDHLETQSRSAGFEPCQPQEDAPHGPQSAFATSSRWEVAGAAAPAGIVPLPAAFMDWLRRNGVDPDVYRCSYTMRRYVRVKQGINAPSLAALESEFGKGRVEAVDWLPGFYSLPPEMKIASTTLYKDALLYGIDVASGAAVKALDPQPGDHCLDLCCAPGAKLSYISDMVGATGSVTGVDCSRDRLASCRTIAVKYGLPQIRLFLCDGRTFDQGAPTTVARAHSGTLTLDGAKVRGEAQQCSATLRDEKLTDADEHSIDRAALEPGSPQRHPSKLKLPPANVTFPTPPRIRHKRRRQDEHAASENLPFYNGVFAPAGASEPDSPTSEVQLYNRVRSKLYNVAVALRVFCICHIPTWCQDWR